jgi:hypothetical protein
VQLCNMTAIALSRLLNNEDSKHCACYTINLRPFANVLRYPKLQVGGGPLEHASICPIFLLLLSYVKRKKINLGADESYNRGAFDAP